MIVVIIAGGSGTRLWPLSTQEYPKHLLRLTNDRSLLQNTVDRVKPLSDQIYVVTERSHSKYVRQQLPEIPARRIIAEPGRRGTASCLLLALSEVRRRARPDQAIFILWGDHLVKDSKTFRATVKQTAELAEREKKLVFVGIEPTYASTGFGYMQKGKKFAKNVFELDQFVEKPNKATAEKYFKSKKYLWNTGYLVGTLETFERELRQHAPRLWNDYQSLNQAILPTTRKKLYLGFVNEALDYALSEHVPDALVMACSFDWADVGSFHDLYGISELNESGNHLSGKHIELEEVHDSYVRNDLQMPVAVIGVDNVAVIATENGILVTNKAQAQKVGDISKKLQAKDRKRFKWLEKL